MATNSFEIDATLAYYSIVNGKAWDPNPQVVPLDVTKQVQQTMYTWLAPLSWQLASDDILTFVAYVLSYPQD